MQTKHKKEKKITNILVMVGMAIVGAAMIACIIASVLIALHLR